MKRRPKQVRGKRPESGARYTVGYRKPPKSTQFQPGQSGNPRGRPIGVRNAAALARAALDRRVLFTDDGIKRRLTVREVAYRQLAEKALAGDLKAINFLLQLADERHAAEGDESTPSAATDLAIVEAFIARKLSKRSKTP